MLLFDHVQNILIQSKKFALLPNYFGPRQRREVKKRNDTHDTGKSFSEALILESTNPQYERRLFNDLPVPYMKTTSSEHGENMLCTQIVLNVKTKTKNNLCAQHVLPMF